MKRWGLFFIAWAWILTSCAVPSQPKTLTVIKEGLNCIPYEKGMDWKRIADSLNDPDIAPLPDPGAGLSRNARVFTNRVLIFYVENEEFKEGEKIRFREVATGLELCGKKK